MSVDLALITKALHESWSQKTSVWGDELPVDNRARGQCVVSSLVVQDFFGGDIYRVKAEGDGINEKHYFNVLDDGTMIDTTRQQYDNAIVSLTPAPVDLKGKYASIREKVLDDADTKRRYELLRKRVDEYIAQESLIYRSK